MASKSLQECLMCTLKPKLQFLNAINGSFNTNNQGSKEPRSGVMGKNWITRNELGIEGPLAVE